MRMFQSRAFGIRWGNRLQRSAPPWSTRTLGKRGGAGRGHGSSCIQKAQVVQVWCGRDACRACFL